MITVIKADCGAGQGGRLLRILDRALEGTAWEETDAADFCGVRDGRVLFCVALSAGGPGEGYRRIMEQLVLHPDCMEGSCGGDIVAEQILDAMYLNKNFPVPGHGILTETANDPRSILKCPGIDGRADKMAARMLK